MKLNNQSCSFVYMKIFTVKIKNSSGSKQLWYIYSNWRRDQIYWNIFQFDCEITNNPMGILERKGDTLHGFRLDQRRLKSFTNTSILYKYCNVWYFITIFYLQRFYKLNIEKLFSKWVIEDESEKGSVCVCVCILMIQPTMLLCNIISNRW